MFVHLASFPGHSQTLSCSCAWSNSYHSLHAQPQDLPIFRAGPGAADPVEGCGMGVATVCILFVPIPLSGFQTGTTMALMASEEVSGEIYVSPPLEEEEEEGTLDEPVSATLVSRELAYVL